MVVVSYAKSIDELRAKHNFLVLAGIEISTDDGHILAFGLDKYVFGMHRARELASYVEFGESDAGRWFTSTQRKGLIEAMRAAMDSAARQMATAFPPRR